MNAHETELNYWTCPDCGTRNSLFLIEGQPLPDELECCVCEHVSGEIEWKKATA